MAFYRVTIFQRFRGREFRNVIHLEDPNNFWTQDAIADKVRDSWIPPFRGCQFNSLNYYRLEVRRILIPTPPAALLKDINIFGNGSATAAVGFEAWKLQFQTGLAGKQHRGRYFVGGIASGFVDLSTERMGVTAISFFANMAITLETAWVQDDPTTALHLVIAHKDESVTPTRVFRINFDTVLCHLHSRKVGVGI